ncbi:MAG: BrnT family toxin [Bacteroidales bacterium]|nr:BrnT family toxin [Bacteroidales bacterium]MCM1415798.1 BrnT family toxin [bacterium]MCM1422708.1 BrnT family toxin [bacterium]
MGEIQFEWDENKNRINKVKHGIDFEEAKTVFYDDYAIVFDDPDHSAEEDRFLILGTSQQENLCIVSHCYRGKDEIIRIISARKATRNETKIYHEYAGGNDYERRI